MPHDKSGTAKFCKKCGIQIEASESPAEVVTEITKEEKEVEVSTEVDDGAEEEIEDDEVSETTERNGNDFTGTFVVILFCIIIVTSAIFNIPLDRAIRKANNIESAMSEQTELWQKVALLLGWNEWELGVGPQAEKEKQKKKKKEKINPDRVTF